MRNALLISLLAVLTACGPGLAPDELPPGDEASGELESEICADGPTVEGIDVSRYQGTINWAGVKAAGKKFAIIQAGRGTSPDPQFKANWAGAKANGIIRGTYLRFFPEQDFEGQVKILVDANANLQPGDLPPMLDVEDRGGKTPAQLAALVQKFVNRLQAATGRAPIIYTGYYFWKDYVKSTAFGAYPLVIANYSSKCPMIPAGWSRWTVHQYSSTGRVQGITGNVDLDRFNGTLAQLQALTQPGTPTPNPVTEKGILTGAIYQNGDTTQRVSGATVTAGGKTLTTGADGLYRFELAPGSYTVSATKAGFEKSTVTRTVTANATSWGSMNLARSTLPPGILTGVVYQDGNTSHRVSGATVTVDGQSQTTGADGLFKFSLPPGSHTAVVKKTGYATASVTRTLVSGQTTWGSTNIQASTGQGLVAEGAPVAPEVATGSAITGGLYRLDTLEAVPGAQLELVDAQGAQVAWTTADELGSYRLELPAPVSGQLVLRAAGFLEQRIAVAPELGEALVVDVGLVPDSAAVSDDAQAEPDALLVADGGCSAGGGVPALWLLVPLVAVALHRRGSARRAVALQRAR